MSKNKKKDVIRAELTPDLNRKFLYLMEKTGFPTKTTMMIHLINAAYDRSQEQNWH